MFSQRQRPLDDSSLLLPRLLSLSPSPSVSLAVSISLLVRMLHSTDDFLFANLEYSSCYNQEAA